MDSSRTSHVSGGVNGELAVRHFIDDATGDEVRAVLKPVHAGGAQEVFAHDVARAMHVDHLLPSIARRDDGTAAIEFRPGQSFRARGISTAHDIEHALRHARRINEPASTGAEIARKARIDRELMQAFDYVLANGDRHVENALFDAASGAVTLIDHGLIDRYDPQGRIPKVRTFFGGVHARQGADLVHSIQLSAESHAILASTDRELIEHAFVRLLADQADAPIVGDLARKQTPAYLAQVMQRLDDVVDSGVVRMLSTSRW